MGGWMDGWVSGWVEGRNRLKRSYYMKRTMLRPESVCLSVVPNSWCWESLKVGGEGDNRGWDGWMASPTQWTWVWLRELVIDREARCVAVHGVAKSWTWLSSWTEMNWTEMCPTLWDPMGFSLTGSSVHGILQVRILEWVAILFSRGSSWPRDQTRVSCTAGRFLTVRATREAKTSKLCC